MVPYCYLFLLFVFILSISIKMLSISCGWVMKSDSVSSRSFCVQVTCSDHAIRLYSDHLIYWPKVLTDQSGWN